ncbi:hypothetical protein U1Q18_017913 [Sarracenia purpurea var. burkii]
MTTIYADAETKDLQNSRAIIFSNFRGSVRDIMDALTNIGDSVKATQFIGQSSGKALKGQSQKVQQAVLEKFRAGGYNVIVATSIGEEGLDIMEVDLVICFDANISPLRMIQRMGRTGRKHDGRVVVLAFQGSELKGYLRKQANGKAVNKHMRNGGMNSFNFHSSPRMIPHIFRPEVQLVELSIEQFIPRGRKVNDHHHHMPTPMFKAKLSNAETDLIVKYFHATKESTWRPSLITFPHFQAFPSRVHKVMHSFRTKMLIDAMQLLQGLLFTGDSKALIVEDAAPLDLGLVVENIEQHGQNKKDLQGSHNSPKLHVLRKISDGDPFPVEILATEEKHSLPDSQGKNPPKNSDLFGSDFVSIDSPGRVPVPSVSLIPMKEVPHSKSTSVRNTVLLPRNCNKLDMRIEDFSDQTASSRNKCKKNKNMPTSNSCNSDAQQENTLDGGEKILEIPVSNVNYSNKGESIAEKPHENNGEVLIVDDPSTDLRDIDLSPRLSNLIRSGVVPESPIDYTESSKVEGRGEFMITNVSPSVKSHTGISLMASTPEQEEKAVTDGSACGDVLSSSVNEEIRNPGIRMKCIATQISIPLFPIIEEVQTPLANSKNNSCSKNWCLSSGGTAGSVQKGKKFKRLLKYGGQNKLRPPEGEEGYVGPTTNPTRDCTGRSPILVKNDRGQRRQANNARAFIEEEAEVSSEVEVSDNEEDDQDNISYDSSFIDDRINSTEASTQAETSPTDMMTIYRRSLLSQSPIVILPNSGINFSPNSVASKTGMSESGRSSGMVKHSLQTPETNPEPPGKISGLSFQLKHERISTEQMPCTTNGIPREKENTMGSRKRKLNFYQVGSVPAINLDQEFLVHTKAASRETSVKDQAQKIETNGDVFDDDQFYDGLNLDEVEEQAAKLLRYKSQQSIHQKMIADLTQPSLGVLGSPSFDLGI